MKTTTLLFMALFFSLQVKAQTVIYQSNFESWTGSYPDGWGGPGTTISPDSVIPYTTFPHSGTKACRLENRTGNWDTLFSTQTVNLIKGHSYSIHFWVRGKGYIYIVLDSIAVNSFHADTLNWEEIKSYNNFIPAQNRPNTKLYIRVYHTNATKDDIQIDDITILDYGLCQTFLDTNNISALVHNNGFLFYDSQSQISRFEVPKGTGKTTIFTSGLWISGLDEQDSLHLAAQRYGQMGYDFQPGPMANNYSDTMYQTKYITLWKIDKSVIDYHINHFNSTGYTMPDVIQNWPANGNTSNGEASLLAPFVDFNNNGIYEPNLGEYPYIRGDQAIYFMINDDMVHGESGGKKLGIEVHGLLYSFNNPSDSALFNTVFLTYNIINRSAINYHDVQIGIFSDLDIGYANDDYIGCDSVLNFFYGYNGDEMDGDGTGNTYGAHPPAQGVALLNHPMSKFVIYFNNNDSLSSPPNNSYNINFPYSGEPENGTGWIEDSIAGERKGEASIGPFSLAAGSDLCVEVAFPFARDYTGTSVTSVALLRQRVQAIKTFFTAQNYDCLTAPQGIQALNQSSNAITVFPNPSDGIFTVHQEGTPQQATLFIYNVLGQCVYSTKINADDTFINLSAQPAGFYHYKITDNKHYTYSGKIIIK